MTYKFVTMVHNLLSWLPDSTNTSPWAHWVVDKSLIAWWDRITEANVWNTKETPHFLSKSLNWPLISQQPVEICNKFRMSYRFTDCYCLNNKLSVLELYWMLPSFGIWSRVVSMWTDVSEEHTRTTLRYIPENDNIHGELVEQGT
jgi:hypothetical protein